MQKLYENTIRLGIGTCVKNERPYLREWITRYRDLKFDLIFVYDNESNDSSARLLETMSGSDLVITRWPTPIGRSPQLTAFEDCAKRAVGLCDYLAFFDVDEFLIEQEIGKLRSVLNELDESVEGILVNQRIVGSNDLRTFGPLSVEQRFIAVTRREYIENVWVKSIVRPSAVIKFGNPHIPTTKLRSFVTGSGTSISAEQLHLEGRISIVDHNGLALNHYILKSYEEFLWKRARGGGAEATPEARLERYANDEFFVNRGIEIKKWEVTPQYERSRQFDETKRDLINDLRAIPPLWVDAPPVLSRGQRNWILEQLYSNDSIVHFGISEAIIDAVYAGVSRITVVSSSVKDLEKLRINSMLQAASEVGRLRIRHADLGPVDDYGRPLDIGRQAVFEGYSHRAWEDSLLEESAHGPSLVIITGRFRVACACWAVIEEPGCKILLRDFADRPQYGPVLEILDLERLIDGGAVFMLKAGTQRVRIREIFNRFSSESL